MEDRLAGYVHPQPEYEIARRRGQPVGLVPRRSSLLNVNVDRTVGGLHEARSVADAVSIDRIWHKMILRGTHSQRPECIVRRKPACRKVHDVVALSGERMARAIGVRPPIHGLLWYVHRAGK